MRMTGFFPPLILGGTGRVGQALARAWHGDALWQHRPGRPAPCGPDGRALPGLVWDILAEPQAQLPAGPVCGLVVLAGVTGSDPAALAANTDLALAACDLAARADIPRVLIASSQAVYGAALGPVTEQAPCHPANPYGAAKLAMERAVAGRPGVTCLRIGNVAGADTLFRMAAEAPITLDRFADGRGPRRAYIGPVTLARTLCALLDPGLCLPPVLNLASPGLVAMEAVLAAADLPFHWRPAPQTALPELSMDLTRLLDLCPLPTLTAADLVAEARATGWSANRAP